MTNTDEKVLIGEASYGADATYKIEIVKTNIIPGTGDDEDPEEIRNDEFGEFFKVLFISPDETVSKAEAGYYSSLDEAKKHLEALYKGIVWHHKG